MRAALLCALLGVADGLRTSIAGHPVRRVDDAATGLFVYALGAGTGLPSLAAARAGAKVLATDRDATSLAYAAAAADDQGLALATAVFDVADFAAPLPPADVVVVADVFVTDAVAAACGRRVGEALRRGSTCVVADARRSTRDAFLAALRAEGFSGAFGASEDPPLLLLDGE
ncbi:hypothetical protein AURANDRAFT_63831 [Aureococcus anophagefferens]|uniref:Methyltransferase domain-containing protein n=1 Tax=Aureococcus anophagefferens TaxID=44056 RepID=F0Y7Y7_AURAN|nr:hypothetical protein AURANDRAFT_63831 [Aureococcus anophagefferens]EGB08513.1 hypothetical protein AURANDRAFT_63831 [Aureococcus anophagefferens]|eukprot:XP_009036523.1 hypothetical protein AURANDRAFT_63831 [Aureococcus anophagefferens]